MGLFLGSRCLEAEQERSCSSALQDATGVRHLPLALAAAGLKAGKFQSGGERRGQCQELSAVGWCSLTSLHSRSRAAGGAVCVLWLWCHQHKGDICPLVTLSPCPDGAKSSLSLCQLRHGTGMPTWQLTPKPDTGGVQAGSCRVCLLLQGAEHIHPPWEILKLAAFFSQRGQTRFFCPLTLIFLHSLL